MLNAEEALQKIIGQLDDMVQVAEQTFGTSDEPVEEAVAVMDVYPGFPERVEGEIIFCDADNINTDGIYPGKYTYQDNVPVERWPKFACPTTTPNFHPWRRKETS